MVGVDFRMRPITQRVISLEIGQFLLGIAEMLVSLQIQHHASAFAPGVGEELCFFGGRELHGETLADFKCSATPLKGSL